MENKQGCWCIFPLTNTTFIQFMTDKLYHQYSPPEQYTYKLVWIFKKGIIICLSYYLLELFNLYYKFTYKLKMKYYLENIYEYRVKLLSRYEQLQYHLPTWKKKKKNLPKTQYKVVETQVDCWRSHNFLISCFCHISNVWCSVKI